MRKVLVLILVALLMPLISDFTAAAPVRRSAQDLAELARELADTGYDGFARRSRGNRADVEALYVVLQFRASADLFLRMVEDKRPESELRDSVSILRQELAQMESYAFGRTERRRMYSLIQDLASELGARGNGGGGGGFGGGGRFGEHGSMRWSGTVDDEVVIMIQASTASVRVVTGKPVQGERYNFDSSLPRREVKLEVNKTEGRGSVDLVEEPSRRNDYSAVIRIRDNKGGTDRYEFELTW
ncbi:MAG: hypothetical protein EHM61_03270 [Acidobacteria bacterium]|nr:MAG: hypothetical protein EHM61_03270 [Acidobacteriota bacterium]